MKFAAGWAGMKMRIWHQSILDLDMAPVYRKSLEQHAALLGDSGVSVTVHGLKPGTYGRDFVPIDAIRHCYLEFLNQIQICEAALTAEREGYDAVAIGCFYDPALRQARSLVKIPVVGLSETCMLVACSFGHKFALVALNSDQQAQHAELAQAYGLEDRLAAVVAMDPPIDEYVLEREQSSLRPVIEGFERACRRAHEAGAEVIIPGDGVLNEFVWRQGIRRVADAPVMDALGVLFRYAEFMVRVGLEVSRIQHYARPSGAMLEHARSFAGMTTIGENEFSGQKRTQQPE
jgi:Asp/Glu/hydantoin racemase